MFLSGKKVIFILAVKTKCLYLSRKRRQAAPQHKNEQVHFIIHSVCTVFAPDKTKKVNENNVSKYILVVAPVTTPTVVREQRSYVYM